MYTCDNMRIYHYTNLESLAMILKIKLLDLIALIK